MNIGRNPETRDSQLQRSPEGEGIGLGNIKKQKYTELPTQVTPTRRTKNIDLVWGK